MVWYIIACAVFFEPLAPITFDEELGELLIVFWASLFVLLELDPEGEGADGVENVALMFWEEGGGVGGDKPGDV